MFRQSMSILFLLLYLLLLYLRPQEFVPALIGVPIMPITMVLATVFWLREPNKDMQAPQFKLMGWLYFLICWSLLKGGLLEDATEALGAFFPTMLIFLLVAVCINNLVRLRALFIMLGIVMTIIAFHSIDQAEQGVGWTGAIPIQGRVTYVGFLSDPNDLSMAMLMVLPMMVYTAWRAGWLMRVFWLACIGAVLYAVKLCDSRGAMLGMACMIAHFCVLQFGVRRSMLVAPVLLIPLAMLGSSRMDNLSSKEASAEGRVVAWQQGFLMFFSNPLFGVGKGQFSSYHYLTAHNSYVLAMAELGIVGFTVWLSNLVLSVLMCLAIERAGTCEPPQVAAVSKADVRGAKPVPPAQDWQEVRRCSRVLWIGMTAALSTMFFLSRSYVPTVYVHMALIVAVWQMARRSNARVAAITWATHGMKMMLTSFASVAFLYVVTRKLD